MVHIILGLSSIISFGKNKKTVLFISFLILLMFAMLRLNYGNDYSSYLKWYTIIQNGGESPYENQVAFTFLNEICSNFYVLIAVTSIIFVCAVYFLIKNNVDSKYYGLAVLVFTLNPYLFLMNLSAIRQSIAIALFIIALSFSAKKKIIPYILLILFATLFHMSAILLLPVYFIGNDKKVNIPQILLILLVIAVFLINTTLFTDIVSGVLDIFDNRSYDYFFENSQQNTIRATLLSSVYFIYVIINIRKLSGKTLMYSKLYLIAMIFALLASQFSMFTRLQMYFDVFSVVSLPGILKQNIEMEQKKEWKIVNVYVIPIMIFVIYVARYYSFFTNPMWESFRTYHTIIDLL